MLNIPEWIKDLFRSDNVSSETWKHLKLRFYDENIRFLFPEDTLFPSDALFPIDQEPFYVIDNSQIVTESLTITESLCENDDLMFGECCASQLDITVADVFLDLTGKEFLLSLEIGGYEMALGIYCVKSFVRLQSDRRKRKITAYNRMLDFQKDVSAWYRDLTFPMSLKEFRYSLCDYIGIEQVRMDLPLDDMVVAKTIDPEQMSGLDVLRAICEINGCFGQMDYVGRLKYVFLGKAGLFPSEELFPDDNLYPKSMGDNENTEHLSFYKQSETSYEDYVVSSIERVQIRQEEGDIGALYGPEGNCYVVQGNFLVYGKSGEELLQIAATVYEQISGLAYRPCRIVGPALPWVEVGDGLVCFTKDDVIETYCLKRTIKAIQAMMDTYEASGNIEQEENFGIHTQIIQLEGKAAVIKKSVEEVSVKVTDLKNYTESQFKVTAEAIMAEVTRAKGEEEKLSGRITVEADRITTEVTNRKNADTELGSRITQTAESITLEVNKKVSKGEITENLNSELKITGNTIELTTGHFMIDSENLTVDRSGNVSVTGKITATSGTFSGEIVGASINIGDGNFSVDKSGHVDAKDITIGTISSRSAIYGSTVLANSFSTGSAVIDSHFEVSCYADMADIGANTITCSNIYANNLKDDCYTFSDRRLKYDIKDIPLEDAQCILNDLRAVSFAFKKDNSKSMGLIAQEVEDILKKHGYQYPLYRMDENGWYTIPYKNFIPLIIRVLQEQQLEINSLKGSIQ